MLNRQLNMYLKSKGEVWVGYINLGVTSIQCFLKLKPDESTSVKRLRLEEGPSTQHPAPKTKKEMLVRWEQSQGKIVFCKPRNGVTHCVVLLRDHVRWDLMTDDWIWQHGVCKCPCEVLDVWWEESLIGVSSKEKRRIGNRMYKQHLRSLTVKEIGLCFRTFWRLSSIVTSDISCLGKVTFAKTYLLP